MVNCWRNRDSIYIENRLNMNQKEPCDDTKSSHGSFNQCRRWDLNPHAVTRTRIWILLVCHSDTSAYIICNELNISYATLIFYRRFENVSIWIAVIFKISYLKGNRGMTDWVLERRNFKKFQKSSKKLKKAVDIILMWWYYNQVVSEQRTTRKQNKQSWRNWHTR